MFVVRWVDNSLVVNEPDFDMEASVYVQVWQRPSTLVYNSTNIRLLTTPLDDLGLQTAELTYRDVDVGQAHIRVLSVPLSIGGRPAGTLQKLSAGISWRDRF